MLIFSLKLVKSKKIIIALFDINEESDNTMILFFFNLKLLCVFVSDSKILFMKFSC